LAKSGWQGPRFHLHLIDQIKGIKHIASAQAAG
jgi:hypothetical protein